MKKDRFQSALHSAQMSSSFGTFKKQSVVDTLQGVLEHLDTRTEDDKEFSFCVPWAFI